MSLANLKRDYDLTQVLDRGYSTIEVEVHLNSNIEVNGTTYFKAGDNSIEEILDGRIDIEEAIEFYENTNPQNSSEGKLYKQKTVKYFSQRSYREIAQIYGINDYSRDESDSEVGYYLEAHGGEVARLVAAIKEYRLLKQAYTEFKSKPFDCTEVQYDDDNGRLIYMYYVDKTPGMPGGY